VEEHGVRLGNPNRPTVPTGFYTAPPRTLLCMGLTGRVGRWPGHSLERVLGHEPMRIEPESRSRSGFHQGNRLTTISSILFSFLVCNLNLNSNLVSIPTSSCNPVEIFCNIVMINFMFQL
jgi:hypothetical protein